MGKTPYSRQYIDRKDITSVIKVLKSDFLTTGPKVLEFEKRLKSYFNSKYAAAVTNATSALHIACLALNLSEKDYLWTTPISFVASSNCGVYCGANIDFVDIDNETFNISTSCLEKKLKETPKKKIPKILVVVHLSGHPIDMKKIKSLSIKYKFKIIEDASHAVGSKYLNGNIGNCRYSDVCVFSFHPVKIITTCEGGAILTNNKKIFDSVNRLRDHGINRRVSSPSNPWIYDQEELGFNYRMNEIQAVLGISQLSKLNKFVNERNKIARKYKNAFKKYDKIKLQKLIPFSKSSMHLFIIRVDNKLRKLIYQKLKKHKINTNLHYIPIYRHSFYKKYKFDNKKFVNSEKYYQEAISIPLYIGMKSYTQNKIIRCIQSIVKK